MYFMQKQMKKKNTPKITLDHVPCIRSKSELSFLNSHVHAFIIYLSKA